MTGLVFALGVLLALAGAVSVVSGAPMIQVERGWAEVIAGAVAVSGGVVTIAIGVVLLHLRTLVEHARRAAQPVTITAPATIAEPAPALDDGHSALRSTRAPDEPVFVASDAAADLASNATAEATDEVTVVAPTPAEPHGRLWGLRRARTETIAEAEPTAMSAAIPFPAAEPLHPAEPEPDESGPQAAPSIAPEIEPESSSPRRLVAASSDLPTPEREPPVRQSSFFQDWRSKPLLRSRRSVAPLPEVPPPLFDAPPGETEESDVKLDASDLDQAPLTTIEDPSVGEEPPAGPAVIGRYQAGASSYTMYADGAIDVETESGDHHRFASMSELKAFIARQEQVVG